MWAAILFLAALSPAPEATAAPDEIVVRAVRRQCRVEIAERILSDPEFHARAEEWAKGKRLRVIVPAGTDYKCLAKIAFRLNDKGVRLFEFVDQPRRR